MDNEIDTSNGAINRAMDDHYKSRATLPALILALMDERDVLLDELNDLQARLDAFEQNVATPKDGD